MIPVIPQLHKDAHLVLLGKDQEQYETLPASVDANGLVMTEYQPSAAELEVLFCGGHIRLWTHTFGHPFQPVSVEAVEPKSVERES